MTVRKFEPVSVYRVTRSSNGVEDTEVLSLAMTTACLYEDIKNPLALKEFYREYTNFARLRFNYTPMIYEISKSSDGYSLNSRGFDLRIIDSIENGRESISFLTYFVNSAVRV